MREWFTKLEKELIIIVPVVLIMICAAISGISWLLGVLGVPICIYKPFLCTRFEMAFGILLIIIYIVVRVFYNKEMNKSEGAVE